MIQTTRNLKVLHLALDSTITQLLNHRLRSNLKSKSINFSGALKIDSKGLFSSKVRTILRVRQLMLVLALITFQKTSSNKSLMRLK